MEGLNKINIDEFTLIITGRENVQAALDGETALRALHSIKEYLRGKEKWGNWDGREEELLLLQDIRENVNEILNDLKIDV